MGLKLRLVALRVRVRVVVILALGDGFCVMLCESLYLDRRGQ